MTSLSDPTDRNNRSGFTLLESVLAFAALAIVLTSLYTLTAGAFQRQIEAEADFESAAMARAVLEEYVATYPAMPKVGTYADRWDWQISETPADGLRPTRMDKYFAFIRITAEVRRTGAEGETPYSLSTIVARRGDF